MKKWISIVLGLLLIGLALHFFFQLYPTRGASLHFKTTTPEGGSLLVRRRDEVRMRLLMDKRLVSAYDLPENQSKRIAFKIRPSEWPLYGVKGSEFEGTALNFDSIGRSICVSIYFRSSDRYSKKIRDLKELISSVIGEEEMRDISISIEVESIFPRLGDGA